MSKSEQNSLSVDTIFMVCKKAQGSFYQICDETFPREVKLQLVNGMWRPVKLDGTDFLGPRFEGLYRGEELVSSVGNIFNPSLGELSFLRHKRDPSGKTGIEWNEQYFLIPKAE